MQPVDTQVQDQDMEEGCNTVVHELLHASWWYSENNDEKKITNAASLAYQYYCDKTSPCYGGTPTPGDQIELRIMLGCSSVPGGADR